MIPEGVERRLHAHVAGILQRAHVPARDRDDVAEELYGHLVERWRALSDAGMEPMRAAGEAVRSFGSAGRIGADLTRTFRGRLWASTIGVLLPIVEIPGRRPRIAWWLSASLWFYAVFGAVAGTVIAANASPVRAVIVLVSSLSAAALYLLAAAALARRQRWGLDIAVVANVIGIVSGAATMAGTPGLISLNVFGSGLILLIAYGERQRLGRWVRRSRSVEGILAVMILATVIGGAILPVAAGEIPEPLQAGPADLHMESGIACSSDHVVVSAELRWDRTSFMPGGVANLAGYGDLLLLENSPTDAWDIEAWPLLLDAASGATVAEPGVSYSPNEERMETFGGPASAAIQVRWDALEAGRTYRAEWRLARVNVPGPAEPFAGAIEYLHGDQFRWEQLVDCHGGDHDPFVSDWP